MLTQINKLILPFFLLLALIIRVPYLGYEMPYFSNEDEAHHYNRTVNMLKSGNLNPEYFLKPSLHFYLRMPVTALAFFKSVSQGRIKSIQDVQTKDDYGLAGYAFSASHPELVKANRLFSVLLLLGTMLCFGLIARQLKLNPLAEIAALSLICFSPELQQSSAVIGVDCLVMFLTSFCCLMLVKFSSSGKTSELVLAAALAGLATSSKYNAAPLVLLPLLASSFFPLKLAKNMLTVLLIAAISFLIGSPFILVEIPLFLDHFAYEIWHYKVSGHEGFLQEPGLQHFSFILNWLATEAIGIIASLLAIVGIIAGFKKWNYKIFIILLAFPCIYLLLMSLQKASFTRNYLILIPFAALFVGQAIASIYELLKKQSALRTSLSITIALLMIFAPFNRSITSAVNTKLEARTDSREKTRTWLTANSKNITTALDGRLQVQQLFNYIDGEKMLAAPGTQRVDLTKESPAEWFHKGFNRIITDYQYEKKYQETLSKLTTRKVRFFGEKSKQRIVKNPYIAIFEFNPSLWKSQTYFNIASRMPLQTFQLGKNLQNNCPDFNDQQCWATSRAYRITFEDSKLKQVNGHYLTTLEAQSPWGAQEFLIKTDTWQSQIFKLEKPGNWQKFALKIPESEKNKKMLLISKKLLKPAALSLKTPDNRFLALGLR